MADVPEQFNAAAYFVDRNLKQGNGGRVALRYGDCEITYQDVSESVNRAANALERAGVSRGDRVLIALYDSPTFVAAFWGTIRLGAIAVPVNTAQSPADYEFVFEDSGARAVLIQDELLDRLPSALSQTGTHRASELATTVLVSDGTAGVATAAAAKPAATTFERALGGSPSEFAPARTYRDDPAFWLYTSGSTGRPKAAIHRHRDMVCCFEGFARGVLNISSSDRTFSASKLFFAYGLGNGLYFPFGVGAETVLVPDRATPERIFDVIARHRPTIFYGVPSLYAAMLQTDESSGAGHDLSSIRCAVSAGEALPAALWQRFRDRFRIEILDGIGSTEMLHMFLSNRAGHVAAGSSGTIVEGYAARIVDESGREVPAGEMGNLWVQGESSAAGYWNRPELTEATFLHEPDGDWTVTGDKYRMDERGYYWHCGRSDDMLKVHGLWVSPLEIEGALLAHSAVLECAVVGAQDEEGLEKPKAFVVLKEVADSPGLKAELLRFLKGRLPSYKLPRWLVLTESLPKTVTGKIQRYRLRKQ